MKKRYEAWRSLSANKGSNDGSAPKANVMLRDHPSVSQLEYKLLLYGTRDGVYPPEIDKMISETSRDLFGIIREDTEFEFPENYFDLADWDEAKWKTSRAYHQYESQFETEHGSDEEIVHVLLKHGLDFRDKSGNPLRCTKLLCRQAEASAKGIKGKLPNSDEMKLRSWGDRLADEAQQHMRKKRTT